MLVILFIIKYHSVLPAVIAIITGNPKIQFYIKKMMSFLEEQILVF